VPNLATLLAGRAVQGRRCNPFAEQSRASGQDVFRLREGDVRSASGWQPAPLRARLDRFWAVG
jgi:hypothetical protein